MEQFLLTGSLLGLIAELVFAGVMGSNPIQA